MIKLMYVLVACLLVSAAIAAPAQKPDYITYNPDKSVKTRGLYETDSTGRVLKFTVFDGPGKLLYTETPYYSPNGAIIRTDQNDASGALQKIVVYAQGKAFVLDVNGKLLEAQPFSQKEFLSLIQ